MNNINFDDKLYDILKNNDKLLQFFINNGFEQLKNEKMLSSMGKLISLNMALKTKQINKEAFREKLELFLNDEQIVVDTSLKESNENLSGDIIIKGILPCPIKIPLLEAFEKFANESKAKNLNIAYDLRSANLGIDWLEEDFLSNDINKISDIFISAGFELFFNKEYIAKYMNDDTFYIDIPKINKDFIDKDNLFIDEKKKYHILSIVPCVFLVDKNNLKDRKIPRSWEELLFNKEYENSVSIPLSDLDMFNAILVNVYAKWKEDGIRALARIYQKNAHPAQMVKNSKDSKEATAINIIPFFFTQMAKNNPTLEVVWQDDGAIASPIFLVAKKDKRGVKEVVEFFTNKETGNILSANGKFPTTIFDVDNNLEPNSKFLFCGFEFINNNDIMEILKKSEKIFNEEILK